MKKKFYLKTESILCWIRKFLSSKMMKKLEEILATENYQIFWQKSNLNPSPKPLTHSHAEPLFRSRSPLP